MSELQECMEVRTCMTLLADSLCVGGEASADYWSASEENHETEGHCRRTTPYLDKLIEDSD